MSLALTSIFLFHPFMWRIMGFLIHQELVEVHLSVSIHTFSIRHLATWGRDVFHVWEFEVFEP
jgi:hypothetical protein